MNRWISGSLAFAITIVCLILLAEFSWMKGDALDILVLSVLISFPIYILRTRYERSVTTILERRHEEKAESKS